MIGRGSGQPAPAITLSAGRAKISAQTKAATGLPGRPNTGLPRQTPIASGRPGFMAMRQTVSASASRRMRLMWSSSPAEAPPEVRIASACAAPRSSAARTAASASGATPRSTVSQPQRRSIASSIGRLASNTASGPASAPGAVTSSPVDSTATRSRRRTLTAPSPPAAICARSIGVSLRPADAATAPAARFSPAGRTLAPRRRRGSKRIAPSATVTSSCIATVSQPCGIGAPVRMRSAAPGATTPRYPAPAAARP